MRIRIDNFNGTSVVLEIPDWRAFLEAFMKGGWVAADDFWWPRSTVAGIVVLPENENVVQFPAKAQFTLVEDTPLV